MAFLHHKAALNEKRLRSQPSVPFIWVNDYFVFLMYSFLPLALNT